MESPNRLRARNVITRSIAAGACAALAALALTGSPAAAADPPPDRSVLQEHLNAVVAAGAPGVVATVRDEHGDWTGVAGVGNVRNGTEPDPDGLLRIGSVTKTFTATLVLQLVAEERIGLDDPVDAHLGGLLPYEEPITVRQLLQHTSGLPDYTAELWTGPESMVEQRFESHTPEQLVQLATGKPLDFAPGGEFAYSNTNYIVLGMLIEEVTGNSVATELRDGILRPAGLHRTYLAGAFPFVPFPAMRGYEAVGEPDGPLTDLTAYNMTGSWTTGAIVAAQADVNRFFAALLSGELLPEEQLAQMRQTVPAFPGFDYGLGLAGGAPCGEPIWGHVGGFPGYQTYSFTDADAERQITVTVNRSETADPAVAEAITAAVAAEFCA